MKHKNLCIVGCITTLVIAGFFVCNHFRTPRLPISKYRAFEIAEEHLLVRGRVSGYQLQWRKDSPVWYMEIQERRGFLPRCHGIFIDGNTGEVLCPYEVLSA